jgi:hypothetical protein
MVSRLHLDASGSFGFGRASQSYPSERGVLAAAYKTMMHRRCMNTGTLH